ncbi:MAG: DUF1932 domain-containing protein [Phycisphaerales bacterium]
MIIGLVHPGAMGAEVGRAARSGAAAVRWASEARSDATRARAQDAGLDDTQTLGELVSAADIVLSVVPPHGAVDQARAALDAGFGGLYCDANAIAPSTAREIRGLVTAAGAGYVDGSLIGPPPRRPGDTRLYLSGDRAGEIAALFDGSILEARVLDGHDLAASALKMCYAAFSKGTTALLANIQQLARAEGVTDALLAEWDDDLPPLLDWAASADRRPHPKAWRFIGEMEQIARAFADRDLPEGFHTAAAAVYRRIADEPGPPA